MSMFSCDVKSYDVVLARARVGTKNRVENCNARNDS
jgi:hypothetical protein